MSVTTSAPAILFGDVSDTGDDTWHKRGRFALRVDARTETELGTLQGRAQVNFDWTTSSSLADRFLGDLDGDGIVDVDEFAIGATSTLATAPAWNAPGSSSAAS